MRRWIWAAAGLAALFAWGAGSSDPPTVTPPPPPLSVEDAKAIAKALAGAAAEGLPGPNVSRAVAAFQSPDPTARAAADTSLSSAAVAYAAEEHGLRIDPHTVDPNFALAAPYDAQADFATARQIGQVAAWVASQRPREPEYDALVRLRAGYAALVQAGGWPTIPAGAALKPGGVDPRVPALRQRLATEGYVAQPPAPPPNAPRPSAAHPNRFDPALSQALAQFQADHGLTADGVLNDATLVDLNIPAKARLAAIDANLERMRWLPRDLPPRRIEVDIGDPQATLFEPGQPTLAMRAIVGLPDKRTPTFAAKVVAIEFNPPWIVPPGIAAKEFYPKERRQRGYFARHGFRVRNGRLVQRAGPKSSLGRLKFDVPDPFDVYLHDTPARSLFDHDKRWLSHGCIRVQNARDLAARLLAAEGWDRARVDARIAKGATATIVLNERPPVFVLYRTVTIDAAGHALFRPDVYGWDAEIIAALEGRPAGPPATATQAGP